MVGGITVSPFEVEEVLRAHPAVREVAVAAVTDDRGATRLRAFVVTATDTTVTTGIEAALIGLARTRLAPFKVPRTVTVVRSLPRTSTGKLRRHLIRQGTW
jgi:fatty-acyl-CoA synthase/benzoate-CoA ligase/fatty acid CoA ligase FadD22